MGSLSTEGLPVSFHVSVFVSRRTVEHEAALP